MPKTKYQEFRVLMKDLPQYLKKMEHHRCEHTDLLYENCDCEWCKWDKLIANLNSITEEIKEALDESNNKTS